MNEFLMFYAPFLVLIGSLFVAFFISLKDDAIIKEEEKDK